MKERLNNDIKAALLRGDTEVLEALRYIKNSLDVSEKQKGSELSELETIAVLRKEVKKRDEAAELFRRGGNKTAADKELKESELIKTYLPEELSESDLVVKIKTIISNNSLAISPGSIGQVIALAKKELGEKADPSQIARVASKILNKQS